jgi:PKD repeat protein
MRIFALLLALAFFVAGPLHAQTASLVTVGSGTVDVGGVLSLPVTLDGAPTGLAGFQMTGTMADPLVAEISGASFPPFDVPELDLRIATSTAQAALMVAAVDLAGLIESGAGEHELVTFQVVGLLSGRSTTLELAVDRLDDDAGDAIASTVLIGTVFVQFPTVLTAPVQDLDGDGLAEDVNANGLQDLADIVDFFQAFGDTALTENVHVFDFNRNGLLDFDDVVTLFKAAR